MRCYLRLGPCAPASRRSCRALRRAPVLRLATLVPALVGALAACEPDPLPTGPGAPGTLPLTQLAVLGHGAVPERFTAEVAARGAFAYTTTWGNRGGVRGDAIKVWSVAGEVPVLVDSVIVEDAITLGDVQISDDGTLLVVATERSGGSIVIHDLTDPARPVRLARHASEETRHTGVHTVKLGRVDGRHYAFISVNPAPPRLVVVDITDPERPVEVLVREMGEPFIHDVFVRDGVLFTALWNGGLTIWDIGGAGTPGASPANPVELGNVRTVGGNAHSVWWYHDAAGGRRYAFVGEEGPGVTGAMSSGDVHVVDVSDFQNPREVAFFHVPGAGAHNFVMDETPGILYVSFFNGGVRALDVRGDLGACGAAQRAADGRCDLRRMNREVGVALQDRGPVSIWGVDRVGDRVYASDMLSGLFVIDASPLGR